MVRLVAEIDGYWYGLDLFQFQYGAIGRHTRDNECEAILVCFNSSMVRLVAEIKGKGYVYLGVSIPVWCDW